MIERQVPDVQTAQRHAPPAGPRPAERTGMLHSVHTYPAFRQLLIGTLATNTAFWMYLVAAGWLALQMTDSAFFVGLSGFTGGIPLLILALPAGVLIDRFDGRGVLLIAQAGVMLVSGVFAALVGTGLVRPWSLLILVAAYGSAMSFVFPSRTTIVPGLVDRHHMSNAIALNAATQNATRVVGPSLAGVLIAVIGVSGTFAVAALLQIIAMYTTYRLPRPADRADTRGRMNWAALTLGFRIVARDPFLSTLILMALAPTVLVMPYINLMPVFARDVLGLGSTGLGLLLASVGLGTVGGALSVARSDRLRSWSSAQVVTAMAFSALILVFAVTPVVPIAAALLFGAGWMSAAYLALNQTEIQLNVDDSVRGRVLSVYMLTWGSLPIGQLAVGGLAGLTGTPIAVALACTLALVCIAAIARRGVSNPSSAATVTEMRSPQGVTSAGPGGGESA